MTQDDGAVAATIRRATAADLGAIDAVHRAHDDPPPGAAALEPGSHLVYFGHVLERGLVLVAELDGRVVGFGASVDTGRAVHLADLFVLPEFLGRGIGGRLLAGVFEDRWPRTTFASDDPRALPLYVRAGMRPYWPNLYVIGDGRSLEPGDDLVVEPAEATTVAEIEQGWTGVDRSADHARWATRRGNRPFVIRSGSDEPVAVGHARDRVRGSGRWLDRLIAVPGIDTSAAIVAALRDGSPEDGAIGACIAGPNPVLLRLLDAGFRIADHDTFMASDPSLLDTNWVYDTGIP